MKHAVITGATGYIGSHLVEYLLFEGWNVSIISRKTSNYSRINKFIKKVNIIEYDNMNQLITFFQSNNIDVVFHLAATVLTQFSPEQTQLLIDGNIKFGTEVLESMKYGACRKFINTGTYWQYFESDDYNPVDLYAASKQAFQDIIKLYVNAYDYRCINLILYDVYGEDDYRPKLFNKIKEIAGTNQSLDISPGDQFLDMVHISDVCAAYLKAYYLMCEDDKIRDEIFGVYTGNRNKLKDIIEILIKIFGKKVNVNIGGKEYRRREVMIPTTKCTKLPNWNAKISLYQGLSRFK